jgi:Holliday junction resolvasome RuvABC endonuclease subunit
MSLTKLNKFYGNTVLGIDSSTNSFAFCYFDGKPVRWGKVVFKGETVIDRIIDANLKINSLMEKIDAVDLVCLESPIMVKSHDASIKMSMVFGSVVAAILRNGNKVVDISPTTWQSYIGNKNFTKQEKLNLAQANPGKKESWYKNQIREIRKQRTLDYFNQKFSMEVTDNDVGDAIGVAYYAYNEMMNHETL